MARVRTPWPSSMLVLAALALPIGSIAADHHDIHHDHPDCAICAHKSVTPHVDAVTPMVVVDAIADVVVIVETTPIDADLPLLRGRGPPSQLL